MKRLEKTVHSCTKCHAELGDYLDFTPVFSFGKPEDKQVFLVGLNPSRNEFLKGHLSNDSDINVRRKTERRYFDNEEVYSYFQKVEPFFKGPAKKALEWKIKPWERIGVLDLVKCPTVKKNKQWTKLTPNEKGLFIKNCEGYLLKQLHNYNPKLVIAYGADVCKWFAAKLGLEDYTEYEHHEGQLGNKTITVLFVKQRQGEHSLPEQLWVQEKIYSLLS